MKQEQYLGASKSEWRRVIIGMVVYIVCTIATMALVILAGGSG